MNIYPTLAEGKQGKDIGAFYMVPGLTLLASCGTGGSRPGGLSVFNTTRLISVAGSGVYVIDTSWNVTSLGTLGTSGGPVSIINNGVQLAIFDGIEGTLVFPDGAYPLTGLTIDTAGSAYAVDEEIILSADDGKQLAAAKVKVTAVDADGGVTAFDIEWVGAFNPQATTFSQASTTGSGGSLTFKDPTYGPLIYLQTINLPFSGPVSAGYQDGFGFVNVSGTNQWYQSNVFDLSIWDALDFSSADAQPDNVVAIADLHREVFLLKQNETEVWINAGTAGFAFQRLEGVLIQAGVVAPASVVTCGDYLVWLSQDEQGQGIVVVVAGGYEAKRISTFSLENQFTTYPTMKDAIGFAYQQAGHTFYQLSFPSGDATWTVDLTVLPALGSGNSWHQRAAFGNGQFSRHWANNYAFFNGKCVVGDYRNGNLYTFDPDAQTDNGTQRKWLRSWRAMAQPSFDPVTFSSLQIDMMTGIGVPDADNPQLMLRWSDDGGHNWSRERFIAAGKTGATAQRVKFNRLGSTRLNHGLDRIFELSSTDRFDVALIGANIE